MINLSLLPTLFLILLALTFIVSFVWLIIRSILKIFTKESWKTTDNVLSIIATLSFILSIICIFFLYFSRPKKITFGGYGAHFQLTDDERDQNPNIALSMMDLYDLFDHFFFRNSQNYDLNSIYDYKNIQDRQTQHFLLTHKETGRLVYIFPSHVIKDSTNIREDVKDIREIFDPIKKKLDTENNWSICLPLGKRTAGLFVEAARFLTSSSVGGHATVIFIEKNNGVITIYHLDPKRHDGHPNMVKRFMDNLAYYFIQEADDYVIYPYINKLSCGVQALANNTHCVYYVFKMVYYYLEGDAIWEMNNLGKNICPGAYIPPNELEAFIKAVSNTGRSFLGFFPNQAHLGHVNFKGRAYLDDNDVRAIGSRARPSRRRSEPAVTSVKENGDEWGFIE